VKFPQKSNCSIFELKLDISEMYAFSTIWDQYRGVRMFVPLHFPMSITFTLKT
jgi:hypothetical protein